jgi:hypothetical protein
VLAESSTALVPATPAEARAVDEVVRLTSDGLAVAQWPDVARKTDPALVRDAIQRQITTMAGASVEEVRRVLAYYFGRVTQLPSDPEALEDAIVADMLELMQIPRRILFTAHRRVRRKWHSGKQRMPCAGDFRATVTTELFEAENYLRLLKQGYTRLHTASIDLNASEFTRRNREAAARKKAEEWEALRAAANKT